MYKIINRQTGALIAVTDTPPYVHVGKNGSWQSCARDDAEALSVRGTKYSLEGKPPVMLPVYDDEGKQTGEEAAPVAIISQIEGGTLVFDALRSATASEQHINDIEVALCDLAIQVAAQA